MKIIRLLNTIKQKSVKMRVFSNNLIFNKNFVNQSILTVLK